MTHILLKSSKCTKNEDWVRLFWVPMVPESNNKVKNMTEKMH